MVDLTPNETVDDTIRVFRGVDAAGGPTRKSKDEIGSHDGYVAYRASRGHKLVVWTWRGVFKERNQLRFGRADKKVVSF